MSDKQNTDKKQPKTQKKEKKDRQKLFNTGKIVVAVLLVLLMLPAMGMVWVKDSQKSPSYCASCHEDPYYTSWSDGSLHLLAEKHALAGISCESCHDRSVGEASLEVINYITGNYYSPLPPIESDHGCMFHLPCGLRYRCRAHQRGAYRHGSEPARRPLG